MNDLQRIQEKTTKNTPNKPPFNTETNTRESGNRNWRNTITSN